MTYISRAGQALAPTPLILYINVQIERLSKKRIRIGALCSNLDGLIDADASALVGALTREQANAGHFEGLLCQRLG